MLYTCRGYTSGESYNAKLGSTVNGKKWNWMDSCKRKKQTTLFDGTRKKIVQLPVLVLILCSNELGHSDIYTLSYSAGLYTYYQQELCVDR